MIRTHTSDWFSQYVVFAHWMLCTAKPAVRQKKLTTLGDGLAKQSEPQQNKFQLESLLVPLTSNSPAVQASVV